ncbi:MAG: GRAM domain-containing protein [Pyrinomonadaceae bacterium]
MKSFLRTVLIAGLPFGLFMGMYYVLDQGWPGVYRGIVSGVLFSFIVAVVTRFRENRALHNPPLLSSEKLIREGRATHKSGNRGVAGRLYLTEKRLFFEGFEKGKPYEISIPIHKIIGAEVSKVWGVLPNRLSIDRRNEAAESFLTDGVSGWADKIQSVRQDYLERPRPESMRLFP